MPNVMTALPNIGGAICEQVGDTPDTPDFLVTSPELVSDFLVTFATRKLRGTGPSGIWPVTLPNGPIGYRSQDLDAK